MSVGSKEEEGSDLSSLSSEENPNKEVRSVAVVKHATVHFSPSFSWLQRNTNLNVPPSNWLRRSSNLEQNIHDFTWHRGHSEFSSIQMANNSPEMTGEVDVISNSKNIKKLLKMPFDNRSHVSLMVHRIGKTLLLDEFDIHKHLLRREQNDWKWLRDFYYDYVAKNMQMKCVPKKNKSRDKLQNRNMYSKFLYHSIVDAENQTLPSSFAVQQEDQGFEFLTPKNIAEDSGDFHREILWTFEDIQMLIGTDLPIFGSKKYPCVSLRLRDMRTPINVLTGLDYWLDNLMCNVPEVAMCFHMNGIVQKYELIKTEEIPNMQDSVFDPQLVTDIARNILSFLKANATKEGHTYWLYKGVDDDVVKLYDLTALCAEDTGDTHSNPFTAPLGMLLYRVARNMRQTSGRKKAATIRTLLENCLILLDEEKHSQICTSACYLLSDLFVPDSSLNDDWSEPSSSDESDDDTEDSSSQTETEDEDKHPNAEMTVEVQSLCFRSDVYNHGNCSTSAPLVPPFIQDIKQRCGLAINHLSKGLVTLERDFTLQIRKNKNIIEEQVQCNSAEAIPLRYEPLQKSAPPHNEEDPALHEMEHLQLAESELSSSWHRLSKVLLLRKAAITFYSLAKNNFSIKKFGCSLRYIKSALMCFAGTHVLLPVKANENKNKELLMRLLGLAGDVRFSLIQNGCTIEEVIQELSDNSIEETYIVDSVNRELEKFDYEWIFKVTADMEKNLECCCQCYHKAISICQSLHTNIKYDTSLSLQKRLGNMKNELGVWYMNQAQKSLQSDDGPFPTKKMDYLIEKSMGCFDNGISIFEKTSDLANQALLHSNIGRLMRLTAQSHTQNSVDKENPEFTSLEREYYIKAIDCYLKALSILKPKGKYTEIEEAICWELSTTYFNMAVLLQDHAPLSISSKNQIEKEVADYMNKSLKYCDTETTSASQPMCLFRAGTVNHRLASLYHSAYRNETSEQRKRYLKQLSESHYKKSAKYFMSVDCNLELLRVQLEQVALQEFYLTSKLYIKSPNDSVIHTAKSLYAQSLKMTTIKSSGELDLTKLLIKRWTYILSVLDEVRTFYQKTLLHEPG
ncbi:hypothetical protein KUTeg_005499 [Tegillarca granosa]|uniref:Erythroid differentiation-related factor 1 n=1 Tax=Tegillarca granosa TaxID=220873 RepID=A0ABQ9FPE6_TEGGR|nr:hypothetical protein KUTeg_005499 [Tegillarca granosa]